MRQSTIAGIITLFLGTIVTYAAFKLAQKRPEPEPPDYALDSVPVTKHLEEVYQVHASFDSLYIYNHDRFVGAVKWRTEEIKGIDSMIQNDIKSNE